jgi:hypothetical protein
VLKNMAHTWKSALVLGLLGVAVTVGCTVETTSGDDDGGESGEGASGGSAGSSGKSTAGTSSGGKSSGGTSGSSSGGKAGSGTAGTSSSGTGGEAGSGDSGAPSTGGSAGAGTSGSGGEGGAEVDPETIPECDPDSGDLDNTPFPDCEPLDPENECEACIQTSCCEESKACFGFDPGNVCGWGGPDATETSPGDGEITCYQECIFDYVDENGFCDTDGEDECIGKCMTSELSCGQIGNQTQDLAGCMWSNCATECFGTDSCGG